MRIGVAIVTLFTVTVLAHAQTGIKAGALKPAAGTTVAQIDLDKMKGQPARLAWSPDGSQLYVQMFEGTFGTPPKKLHHHLVSTADGKHHNAEEEPEWAAMYWTAKSGQTSPDGPPLKIDVKEDIKIEKPTSSPMGGDLAKGAVGGTGSSTGDAMNAAANQQQIHVITTTLLGTTVGVFEGTVLLPGRTFGWGPKGSRAIVYTDARNGRVMLMDDQGAKIEVPASKDAILPAWSPDGKQIAWLQKEGRKKYVLQVARVEGM